MLKLHVKNQGFIMHKKHVYFFLCFAVAQTSLSMQQLARPALTQASAAIATIVPQLTNASRSCATNSSKSEEVGPNNEFQDDATSNKKLEKLEKSLKAANKKANKLNGEVLKEQRKQTRLLEEANSWSQALLTEQQRQTNLLTKEGKFLEEANKWNMAKFLSLLPVPCFIIITFLSRS
jgi:cob(I)alamin adenosyltransferase